MRITKAGVALCSLYLIASFGCVVWAQFISDPKGKYMILQMPVVLQHGLLIVLNATEFLKGMSWPIIYFVLGVPMLVLLILIGNIIEFGVSRVHSGVLALDKALRRTGR